MRDINQNRATRAGLRRLWFVLSAIWLVIVSWLVATDSGKSLSDWFYAGLLPVVAIYALFAGIAWVVEGFRSQ
jgi:polyferredoxin